MNVNPVDDSSTNKDSSPNAAQAVDEATQQVEKSQQSSVPEESAALTLGLLKQVKNNF